MDFMEILKRALGLSQPPAPQINIVYVEPEDREWRDAPEETETVAQALEKVKMRVKKTQAAKKAALKQVHVSGEKPVTKPTEPAIIQTPPKVEPAVVKVEAVKVEPTPIVSGNTTGLTATTTVKPVK